MAGNVEPIYSRVGDVSSDAASTMPAHIITAVADYTGASANYVKVFTADATNGSYLQRLRFTAEGTNTASVARIFINNGTDHTSAGNNNFFGQVSLPATTAIDTAATIELEYPMNVALNPGFSVWVGLGTTVASGWRVIAIGGKY